jgi:hypothetical protein
LIGAGICTVLILSFTLTNGHCREAKHNRAMAPAKPGSSAQRMLPDHNTGECGGVYVDRATGATRKIPNVDLIVTRIEVIKNARGTWVKPWIKNRCSGTLSKPVHVSIGDVVVTIAGVAGGSEKTTMPVGVRPASSYTAIVDYDHRISEANESNNRCTRSTSGRCR